MLILILQFRGEKLVLNPFKFESNKAMDDGMDESSVLQMPHKLHGDHRKVGIFS